MNTFVLRPLRSYAKVTFYTVALEGSDVTEYEKFYESCVRNVRSRDFREMMALFAEIGEVKTALPAYFRNEAVHGTETKALPPNTTQYAGMLLRLYCKVLSPHIVVTFGGGMKTKGNYTAQECPIVRDHFAIANGISAALDTELFKSVRIGLSLDGKTLEFDEEDQIPFTPKYT